MSESASARTMQPEDWQGERGELWLAHIGRFESMISPVGEALVARAAVRPGDTIIDIGCGGRAEQP